MRHGVPSASALSSRSFITGVILIMIPRFTFLNRPAPAGDRDYHF
jgi:hypothetical protein